MTGPRRVYPEGDLRAVLRQRFGEVAARTSNPVTRQRARALAQAIDAGQPVTVTLDELTSALWHAGLIDAEEKTVTMPNAGHQEYTVALDGSYEPV